MEKTLGQINYDTYCETRGWNDSVSGVDLPPWSAVKPESQHAWEMAAKKVLFTFAVTITQHPEKADELADALELSGKWPKD